MLRLFKKLWLIQDVGDKWDVFWVYLALLTDQDLLDLLHTEHLQVIVLVDHLFLLFEWIVFVIVYSWVFAPPGLVRVLREVGWWSHLWLDLLL